MRLTPTMTRELLERHGLRPAKRLGQHFLIDPNVVDRIVRSVDGAVGDPVVEIGAGLGTLTQALVEAGYDVLAFEVDERLRPALLEVLGDRADLRFENAARLDFGDVLDDRRWIMAANLPYNVGTPIVLDALRRAFQIERFVVMLQAEVIDRLTASAGDDEFGLPSVVAGLHARVVDRFSVPAHLFLPRPAVDSAVVVLDRVTADARASAAIDLAARAFSQRRKMLRSSLRGVVPSERLVAAGIDPSGRPEEVEAERWLEVVDA